MAGLNIPKREQLENGPKLADLNRARLKAQDRLSDYAGRMAEKDPRRGKDYSINFDNFVKYLENLDDVE